MGEMFKVLPLMAGAKPWYSLGGELYSKVEK